MPLYNNEKERPFQNLATTLFSMEGITCAKCVKLILTHLEHFPGIFNVDVSIVFGVVRVIHDAETVGSSELLSEFGELGFVNISVSYCYHQSTSDNKDVVSHKSCPPIFLHNEIEKPLTTEILTTEGLTTEALTTGSGDDEFDLNDLNNKHHHRIDSYNQQESGDQEPVPKNIENLNKLIIEYAKREAILDLTVLGDKDLFGHALTRQDFLISERDKIIKLLSQYTGILAFKIHKEFIRVHYDPLCVGARYILSELERHRCCTRHCRSLQLVSPFNSNLYKDIIIQKRLHYTQLIARKIKSLVTAILAFLLSLILLYAPDQFGGLGDEPMYGLKQIRRPFLQLLTGISVIFLLPARSRNRTLFNKMQRGHVTATVGLILLLSMGLMSIAFLIVVAFKVVNIGDQEIPVTVPMATCPALLVLCFFLTGDLITLSTTAKSLINRSLRHGPGHLVSTHFETYRLILRPESLQLESPEIDSIGFFVLHPSQFEKKDGPWLSQLSLDSSKMKQSDPMAIDVHFEILQIGDIIAVRTGQKFPVDGVILGQKSVMMTPVSEFLIISSSFADQIGGVSGSLHLLRTGDLVFAGDTNVGPPLLLRILHVGNSTTEGQFITLLKIATSWKISWRPSLLKIILQRSLTLKLYFRLSCVIGIIQFCISLFYNNFSSDLHYYSHKGFVVAACLVISSFLKFTFVVLAPAWGILCPIAIHLLSHMCSMRGISLSDPSRSLSILSTTDQVILEKTGVISEGLLTLDSAVLIPTAFIKAGVVVDKVVPSEHKGPAHNTHNHHVVSMEDEWLFGTTPDHQENGCIASQIPSSQTTRTKLDATVTITPDRKDDQHLSDETHWNGCPDDDSQSLQAASLLANRLLPHLFSSPFPKGSSRKSVRRLGLAASFFTPTKKISESLTTPLISPPRTSINDEHYEASEQGFQYRPPNEAHIQFTLPVHRTASTPNLASRTLLPEDVRLEERFVGPSWEAKNNASSTVVPKLLKEPFHQKSLKQPFSWGSKMMSKQNSHIDMKPLLSEVKPPKRKSTEAHLVEAQIGTKRNSILKIGKEKCKKNGGRREECLLANGIKIDPLIYWIKDGAHVEENVPLNTPLDLPSSLFSVGDDYFDLELQIDKNRSFDKLDLTYATILNKFWWLLWSVYSCHPNPVLGTFDNYFNSLKDLQAPVQPKNIHIGLDGDFVCDLGGLQIGLSIFSSISALKNKDNFLKTDEDGTQQTQCRQSLDRLDSFKRSSESDPGQFRDILSIMTASRMSQDTCNNLIPKRKHLVTTRTFENVNTIFRQDHDVSPLIKFTKRLTAGQFNEGIRIPLRPERHSSGNRVASLTGRSNKQHIVGRHQTQLLLVPDTHTKSIDDHHRGPSRQLTILEVIEAQRSLTTCREGSIKRTLKQLNITPKDLSDAQCDCDKPCPCKIFVAHTLGLASTVMSLAVAINTPYFKALRDWNNKFQLKGDSTIFLHANNICIGGVALKDPIKVYASQLVSSLLQSGRDVWLCTNEDFTAAQNSAELIGIQATHVVCQVMPKDRIELVLRLSNLKTSETSSRSIVCFVGAKASDSLASFFADIGIVLNNSDKLITNLADVVIHSNSDLKDLEWLFLMSSIFFSLLHYNSQLILLLTGSFWVITIVLGFLDYPFLITDSGQFFLIQCVGTIVTTLFVMMSTYSLQRASRSIILGQRRSHKLTDTVPVENSV